MVAILVYSCLCTCLLEDNKQQNSGVGAWVQGQETKMM